MALFQALASQRMTQKSKRSSKALCCGSAQLRTIPWGIGWMTSGRWDAGTGWKLPVLKAILDDDPKKLNQVSFQQSMRELEGLNERGPVFSM